MFFITVTSGDEPDPTFREIKNNHLLGLPWGPVVKILHFHCSRRGLDPWSGKYDPTCCVWCGQKKKEKRKSPFYYISKGKVSPGTSLGGAVVKNPTDSAGNMGSSPGPGRSHMPRSN